MEMKAAEDFVDPVDKEDAPDYYDVIKNPMCLKEMKRKVKNGDYDTPNMVCN